MSNDIVIECRDLSCGYPERTVLQAVDLSIKSGTVTALLGPNGSGKSTFLRTLTKTLAPLSGQALVNGADVTSLSYKELAKQVAFVPQEEQAAFGFTVRQVVVMGRLPISGGFFDTVEDHEAAERAMTAADCLQLQHRPVTELSVGERQRVLIARALAQDARILLMDEPTSHLDVGHQVSTGALLRKLTSQGYTVLVAVHDLNLAGAFADDGILLASGKIGLHAPIGDILRSPLADSVYGVDFKRIEAADSRLYIFPHF